MIKNQGDPGDRDFQDFEKSNLKQEVIYLNQKNENPRNHDHLDHPNFYQCIYIYVYGTLPIAQESITQPRGNIM